MFLIAIICWSRIYILYGVGNVSFTALQTSDWNQYTLCKGIKIESSCEKGLAQGVAPQIGQACVELVPVSAFTTLSSITIKYRLKFIYTNFPYIKINLQGTNLYIWFFTYSSSFKMQSLLFCSNFNFNGPQNRIDCGLRLFQITFFAASINQKGVTVVAKIFETKHSPAECFWL